MCTLHLSTSVVWRYIPLLLSRYDGRWDHLVEDTGEDTKEKKDTDLVLGSRLDKGDRPRGYDNNDDDFEEDAGNEDDKNDGDNGEREGGSVMSLSSNDFKFSTTSNIP